MNDQSPASLLLDYNEFARVAGGEWRNYQGQPPLTGVSVNREYMSEGSTGNFYFLLGPKEEPKEFTRHHLALLQNVFELGAAAAVVPRNAKGLPENRPLLLVDDVRETLEKLALHVRDRFTGKRVLVTGTEGKTGFKCMLGHVLAKQIPTQFACNSGNLESGIYASLASIRREDRVAIIEASVAQPGRGVLRSNIVKPHVAVITEVGNEHLKYHGSMEVLIESKAGIVDGVVDGGYCILNADSGNYLPVRKAVLATRRLPILLFGSAPWCNGRLLGSEFVDNGWRVTAEIEGEKVEYHVPVLGEHIPLASVSVLLTAYYLGADVVRAAAGFSDFKPYESQGVLRTLLCNGGEVRCFENASRASVLSFQSTLSMVPKLQPLVPEGKKVGVIGEMVYLGKQAEKEHKRLAEWIDAAGFDRVILIGANTKATLANLKNPDIVIKQFFEYDRHKSDAGAFQALIDGITSEVHPGDFLFVKGELDELGVYLRTLEVNKDRQV